MLAVKSQGKIVQKVLRTKTGEQVLAVFFVTEENGELQVRLLSVSPVGNSEKTTNYKLQTTNSSFCLPGRCLKFSAVTSYRHNYHSVVSPFFNALEFFVSQPTRAPAL